MLIGGAQCRREFRRMSRMRSGTRDVGTARLRPVCGTYNIKGTRTGRLRMVDWRRTNGRIYIDSEPPSIRSGGREHRVVDAAVLLSLCVPENNSTHIISSQCHELGAGGTADERELPKGKENGVKVDWEQSAVPRARTYRLRRCLLRQIDCGCLLSSVREYF
jgi:hypothetical protein